MEKQDTLLWNQYQNLREEIRGADSLNYQIMALVFGAVAALLTAAIREPHPLARALVFLCVYVVTIPAYRLQQGNRLRIWRISTYLRVFVEPDLDFVKWEIRLNAQREEEKKSGQRSNFSTLASINEWIIISLVNTLAAVGAISSLYEVAAASYAKFGGIAAIVVAHLGTVFWTSRQEKRLRRLSGVEQEFLKSWTRIRENEAQTPSEARRWDLQRIPDCNAEESR